MDVFINGRFLTQRVTGVQRYALELVTALDRLGTSWYQGSPRLRFSVLAPRKVIHEITWQNIPVHQVGRLSGHVWEQLELPALASKGLLLNLANTGPLLHPRQVVTIHDAIPLAVRDSVSTMFRTWYGLLLPRLANIAKVVVTVSEFSKQEITRYYRVDSQKIKVIYPGAEQLTTVAPDERILDKQGLRKRPYLLAVGSMNRIKNFRAVVDAIELLRDTDVDVVIAGGVNARVFTKATGTSNRRIKYTGYVSDAELRCLYENANCFVFPSLYEGFGLPPLEAMSVGTPVAAAQAGAIPEVCGDAVEYFDPRNPSDLAAKIRELMTNDSLRDRLRDRGRERVRRFTWEAAATELMTALQHVAASVQV